LITLDEPVHSILPELDNVGVLSKNEGPDASTTPYFLKPTNRKVTVRHLLSHCSGIDYESNPWVQEWRAHTGEAPKDYRPSIVPDLELYSAPLLYEPREGWMYGASVEWTEALVSRLTGVGLGKYVQEHIFDPLNMSSSTYFPQNNPGICSKLLQMVRRDGDKNLPVDFPVGQMGLVCSASDISKLFIDLTSPSSKLLRKDLQDLLFTPQFAPSSATRAIIRRDTEMYAIPTGIPHTVIEPPVNHSLGTLVIEEAIPLSGMPAGTVTWNGMPNLIWAIHPEKGVAMAFLTQILPVDDEKTMELAMGFIRAAWKTVG
jgi:CubicO group peptidase (beta-lactamase class C family)